MKGVAKLKDEARKHEQREDWEKAIDAYLQVLKSTEGGDEEVDLPLYNRVGDLFVRLGKPADAVEYYEQAADQYAEAGLYNNAIALCNKALRYVPNRLELIRKLGQFSGAQGFLTDSRRWYLEYAERQLKAGALDEAFKALEDFATVHEDAEIRELLGRQLKANHRIEPAVEALKRAYVMRKQAGELDDVARLKAEILDLAPEAFDAGDDFGMPPVRAAALPSIEEMEDHPKIGSLPPTSDVVATTDLGLETAAGAAFGEEPEETGDLDLTHLDTFDTAEEVGVGFDTGDALGEIDLEGGNIDLDGEPATWDEVPTLELEDLDLEDDLGGELPMLELEADDLPAFEIESVGAGDDVGLDLPVAEDAIEDLPLDDFERFDPAAELRRGEELAASGNRSGAIRHFDDLQVRLAAEGYSREAWQACTALLQLDPSNARILQQRVEYASALSDNALLLPSYLELARNLVATGDVAQAKGIFQRVLDIDPDNQEARKAVHGAAPRAASGYVDLMAYIGEDDERDSTRFVVAEKPPTGDEERDFADMLSQFRQKVAENVSVGEAAAHYDLGLAFKEMGLIDEAISEFQTALKGGEERLKVYEELGQCFLLKQQYNVAVTVLTRALQMPVTDDSALVGVYYALARSHEELGHRDEARQAYERVVGLDINFRDASRRLASL